MKELGWKLICLVAGCVLAGTPAIGQEAAAPAETDPETQAMMEAWAGAMAVGPQHEELAEMSGSWHVTATFWMTPDGEPMSIEGKADRKMILGGRVLSEKFSSEFMGQPFEGLGLTGYDNVTEQYWSTWTDNMSTGLMKMTGTCGEDGNCTYSGSFVDPASGEEMQHRFVVERIGEDAEKMVGYVSGPEVSEYKMMEMTYERTMTSQAAQEMKEAAAAAEAKAKEMKEKAEKKMGEGDEG